MKMIVCGWGNTSSFYNGAHYKVRNRSFHVNHRVDIIHEENQIERNQQLITGSDDILIQKIELHFQNIKSHLPKKKTAKVVWTIEN